MVTSLCTQCDVCLVLILVANIPLNMSMFGSMLDNSLSFQCADFVAWFFSCAADSAVSLGGSMCNLQACIQGHYSTAIPRGT